MRVLQNLAWACVIVTVAAYGSIVVRNVTEALVGLTSHQSLVIAQSPHR